MAVDQAQPTDQYFATLPAEKLAPVLMSKCEDYWEYLSATGRLTRWRKAYLCYYQADYDLGSILRGGLNGEYVLLPLNHFKNLIDHLHNLICSQKFSYQPVAVNTDYKSQAAAILSKGLLEYFDKMPEKNVTRKRKRATRFALLLDEGWITLDWDPSAGDAQAVNPDGTPRMAGDFLAKVFLPTDVIRDVSRRDSDNEWIITREYRNKWNLAARYPEMAEKIKALQMDPDDLTNLRLLSHTDLTKSDLVPVYVFRHAKTPAIPEGRYFEFLEDDIWTIDSGLPYKNMMVYRVVVEDQEDSCFGYTHMSHLLPIQEQLNNLASMVATNHSLGVTNVLIPEGANVTLEQLAEGMNGFKYNPMNGMKPEAFNLVNTPKEIFSTIEMYIQQMEVLAGVNSVVRGEVPTNLRSGSALALVASQAIQFSSGLQESYTNLIADTSTGIIQLLQDFPLDPRVALIAGKVNQPLLKEWQNSDLAPIQRVQIELANPLASTTAGRVQMAENLIQNGIIKDPQKYLMVLQTGTLEPEIEGQQAEMLLIKQENESLAQGMPVQAIKTENHPLHITEHKAVLASLQSKSDPKIVQATLTHIQEHIQLMMTMQLQEPMLAQMLGLPPMAMPPMAPSNADSKDSTPPDQKKAAGVNEPNLPSLPPGSPPAAEKAYEQIKGPAANPTNNARAQGAK
jgi:hypothetical protein